MKYELAVQLRDAGFPYTEESFREVYPPGVEKIPGRYIGAGMSEVVNQGQVRLPTLSELLKACGKDFMMLVQRNEDQCWGAVSTNHIDERGATPEDAIGRLWLRLREDEEIKQDHLQGDADDAKRP